MRGIILFTLILLSVSSYSQDTSDYSIKPKWVNPNEQKDSIVLESFDINEIFPEKIIPKWMDPQPDTEPLKEQLTEEDIKMLEGDVKFMTDLPQNYESVPKEDLKNVLVQIDNKITQLRQEIDKLIKERANQEVIKTKKSTLTVLEKEKNIINLTLTGGELRDANGNLIGENDELKIQQDKLKKYLYTALGGLAVLGLIIAIVLQRRRIQVQDVEIEDQVNEINKKNSYLEHAARIIRHDMHSGINTYMPRGISSLIPEQIS